MFSRFSNNPIKYFCMFKSCFSGLDEEDGQCGNEEIINIIRQYSELCTLFDFSFLMARRPAGELTEAILDESR
jgi:hypothetical protein